MISEGAVKRDWQNGSVTTKQPAMIDTFTKRFNHSLILPCQPSPTRTDDGGRYGGGLPFQAGGWRCHLAGHNDKTGHR